MVVDWSSFVDIWDWQTANFCRRLPIFIYEEVLCNIGVLDRKLLELFVCQRLVIAAFSQSSKQVPFWNFPFVNFLFFFGFRLHGFGWCCLFLSVTDNCAMLYHQLHDLISVVFLCKHHRCGSSFVLVHDVDPLFQQKFNHFVAALLNRVVDWSLAISVNNVIRRSCINQLLGRLNVSFANTIENRILAVCVQMVHIGPFI